VEGRSQMIPLPQLNFLKQFKGCLTRHIIGS
jgi:hypothetical protein